MTRRQHGLVSATRRIPVRGAFGRALPAAVAASAMVAVAGLATPAWAQSAGRDRAAGAAEALPAADLPVTGITLYRSGVGSFVRSGTVTGDASVVLRLDAKAVSDVLKTLVAFDTGGGRVESVTYAADEPLSRRLSGFAIDVSDSPSRANILRQLRGHRVTLTGRGTEVTGVVLGVEREELVEDGVTMARETVTVVSDTGLQSRDLSEVTKFEILDERLADDLRRALAVVAEDSANRSRPVTVRLRGEGDRGVALGYVQQTPVWKTSYRLVLPEAGSEDDSGRLQAWAVVDNTTDEDWESVRLSLVAGRPIAFTMNLYTPLYLERPGVQVPVEFAAAPRVYGGSIAELAADMDSEDLLGFSGQAPAAASPQARGRVDGGPMGGMGGGGGADRMPESRVSSAAALKSSFAAGASTEGAGEVFRLTLDEPVTIERGRSALLPILGGEVEARRVSVYEAGSGEHPLRGVEMTNTTSAQLMPGPVAVYVGDTYAGDAQVQFVPQGDERLLTYAMDLEVRIASEDRRSRQIVAYRVDSGRMVTQSQTVFERSYTIRNADEDEGRTLVFQEPLPGALGMDEVASPEPAERTADHLRFETEIEPGGEGRLVIRYTGVTAEARALLSYQRPQILQIISTGRAPERLIEQFDEASRLQSAVASLEQELAALQRDERAIVADQERIRQNLGALEPQHPLAERLLEKLDEQETELERLRAETASAEERLRVARERLSSFIENLDLR